MPRRIKRAAISSQARRSNNSVKTLMAGASSGHADEKDSMRIKPN
jgi:hypothetical protein